MKLLLAVPNEGPPPLDALHHGHCQSGPEGGQHRGPHRPCSRSYRRGTGPGASRHGGPCGGQERKRRRYQNGGRRQTCQKLQLQLPDQASPNTARLRWEGSFWGKRPQYLRRNREGRFGRSRHYSKKGQGFRKRQGFFKGQASRRRYESSAKQRGTPRRRLRPRAGHRAKGPLHGTRSVQAIKGYPAQLRAPRGQSQNTAASRYRNRQTSARRRFRRRYVR